MWGRGGGCSSWSLQASRLFATKDRCSGGMPRRNQLRYSTYSRHWVLGRPLGFRPIGVERSSFLAVLSKDIRVTCPYQRSCDFSSWRSSNSVFKDSRISALLTLSNKVKPRNSSQEFHFGCLNLRSHFLIHDPSLMTISQNRNIDQSENG